MNEHWHGQHADEEALSKLRMREIKMEDTVRPISKGEGEGAKGGSLQHVG